eukprot:gene8516-11513_t
MKIFNILITLCTFTSSLQRRHNIHLYPWDLPVLPLNPPSVLFGNATPTEKLIPRHLWIAVRELNDSMNYQMPALFARNPLWQVHIESNEMKDKFMNDVFANTSMLWAYNSISPRAGAAKADLWRYAVLWAYGGVYIDDDSDIKSPLDSMILPDDTLIVSYEKNGFNADRCYIPRYHLSDFSTFRNASKRSYNIFYNRCLLNWAMVSAPRHPIIFHVMKNAVEIIKHEYFKESVMRSHKEAYTWEAIMCATGPSLLTASAREVLLMDMPGVTYRLANNDFKDYGGKFKAVYVPVKNDPAHYMNMKTVLLSEYLPERPVTEKHLKRWEGFPIQGQNGKEIFCIVNGTKRGFPNWDSFIGLNFTMADVFVISDIRLASIPRGPSMPDLSV